MIDATGTPEPGGPAGQGPGAAARRRGGDAQQRLVAAATEVIAERGWLGVTTRLVATRAGLNPGLVHYHFGSVENLRRAAAAAAGQGVMEGPLGQMFATGDLAAGLAATVRALGELDWEDPQMRVLLEASLYATHDRELGAVMAGLLSDLRTDLARRIEESVAAGRMRPCDPVATAALLAALLDGVGLHRLLDTDLDLEAMARALLALLTDTEAR